MAGAVRIAVAARNAMLDALLERLHGGSLELYTAPQPATADAPIDPSATLIGALSIAAPAGPLAGAGQIELDVSGGVATGAGVVAWARLRDEDDDAVLDLPVGETGSNRAIELDSTTVEIGQPLELTAARISIPAA